MSIEPEPPLLPKNQISSDGTSVIVKTAELKTNFETSIGHINQGLILEVNIKGKSEIYSQIFSIDKDPIKGSAARVLAKLGIKNVSELTPKVLGKLVGMEFVVNNNEGKLYWN